MYKKVINVNTPWHGPWRKGIFKKCFQSLHSSQESVHPGIKSSQYFRFVLFINQQETGWVPISDSYDASLKPRAAIKRRRLKKGKPKLLFQGHQITERTQRWLRPSTGGRATIAQLLHHIMTMKIKTDTEITGDVLIINERAFEFRFAQPDPFGA